MSEGSSNRGRSSRDAIERWECHCQTPPVLLGTHDSSGTIHIKVRDRYWHIIGSVKTACPRCGTEHILAPEAAARGCSGNFELFEVVPS
jgi:hypothetical protein